MTRPGRRTVWVLVLTVVAVAAGFLVLQWRSKVPAPGRVVRLDSGLIQGSIEDGVEVYRGVPFAAPPLGELRWRAPQPVRPWNGVREATSFQRSCMQVVGSGPVALPGGTSEDCLYLNIWAPKESGSSPRPVMVWIHGGGGTTGSPSSRLYWGDQIARRGVIVVGLSYRLGALGFLAHPDLTAEAGTSGNYGLLDLVAGLRWVQRNIAAFGGDPGNVTIFGHSAGAWLASKLMTSPLAAGLFQRVIAESGGDFGPAGTRDGVATLADAEQAGVAFANSFGTRSINELRAVPADKIIAAPRPPIANSNDTQFTIVDGQVIPDDAYASYEQGKQISVPLLVGYNAAEGRNLVEKSITAKEFAAQIRSKFGPVADRALAIYPARSDDEAVESQWRLQGEVAIAWQVATWARVHARTSGASVYVYLFDHTPPIGPLSRVGPAHGAELPYVFGFPPNPFRYFLQWPWKARRDVAVADEIQTYWTNFAKSGNPNSSKAPPWPSFSGQGKVLDIAAESVPIDMPNAQEHAVIDDYMAIVRTREVAVVSKP